LPATAKPAEIARADAYPWRDFEKLVAAATRAGIRTVPIVNLLGHTQYLVKHPARRDLNELRAPDELRAGRAAARVMWDASREPSLYTSSQNHAILDAAARPLLGHPAPAAGWPVLDWQHNADALPLVFGPGSRSQPHGA
jgi:hypothetical protein